MYLARLRIKDDPHFVIRQSYAGNGCMKSRDIFDLGPDPSRFIVYPGGSGYYFDPCIEDVLEQKGIRANENALDRIFFPFLRPDIRRVISGFDRSSSQRPDDKILYRHDYTHNFDKRRYHYLRFGHSTQRNIDKVPRRVFRPLMQKSRDELEQYFHTEEHRIGAREKVYYLATIFQLNRMQPQQRGGLTLTDQMDAFFVDRLCRLNTDEGYLAGTADFTGLYPYLARYAIDYFDGSILQENDPYAAFREFIRRHRVFRPPHKVQLNIKAAEKLFGCPWKTLKAMNRSALSRRYRRAAIRHHPDQGGDPDTFRRLTQVYKALLDKKPKGV